MRKDILENRGDTQRCGREETRKPSAGVTPRLSYRRLFAVVRLCHCNNSCGLPTGVYESGLVIAIAAAVILLEHPLRTAAPVERPPFQAHTSKRTHQLPKAFPKAPLLTRAVGTPFRCCDDQGSPPILQNDICSCAGITPFLCRDDQGSPPIL